MKIFTLILISTSILFINITANEQNTSCKAMFECYNTFSPLFSTPTTFINFKDYSTGDIVEWEWSVNDSVISRSQKPRAYKISLYHKLPVYHVCLKIKTKDGCTSDTCKDIVLGYSYDCEVKFNHHVIPIDSVKTPTMFKVGYYRPVMFTGISAYNVVKWEWDFGDSIRSNEQNPVHNYILDPTINEFYCMKKGTNCIPAFYVCLTITTSDGCQAFDCDFVDPNEYLSAKCNAAFLYKVLESNPPLFSFQNTSDWEGGSAFWSFGDGTYSSEQNPIHKYSADPGSSNSYKPHTACLAIKSTNGCTNMSCQTIYNDLTPSYNTCNYHIKLNASFPAGTAECNGSAIAELTDNNGNIVNAKSYLWSDGGTDNEISNICPNEPFKVFITDEQGCVTRGEFVLSGATNPVYVLYNFDDKNFSIQYENPSQDYNYTWKFCDGSTKTGDNVSYSSSEDCLATLIISDNSGTEISNQKIYLSKSSSSLGKNIDNNIKLYPNPADKELNVQINMPVQHLISIKILDMNGRVWLSQKKTNTTYFSINIEDLPKGAYLCRIQTGNVMEFRKFIK